MWTFAVMDFLHTHRSWLISSNHILHLAAWTAWFAKQTKLISEYCLKALQKVSRQRALKCKAKLPSQFNFISALEILLLASANSVFLSVFIHKVF